MPLFPTSAKVNGNDVKVRQLEVAKLLRGENLCKKERKSIKNRIQSFDSAQDEGRQPFDCAQDKVSIVY